MEDQGRGSDTGPEPPGPAPARRTLPALGLVAAGLFIPLAMRELSWLLAPLLLAAVLITLVYPVHTRLAARGVPVPAAVGGLLLAVYGSVLALTALIIYALARFASLLPSYSGEIQSAVTRLRAVLRQMGIDAPQAGELLEWIDVPATARWLTGQLPSLVGLAAMVVLIGTVLVFLGIESTQLDLRSRALRRGHRAVFDALALSAARTRTFFGVTTVFAVTVGVLDTLLLLALGIPLAPLWGLLAAACNYIPYLGFWIGMVPPALLALALHGWETTLVVVAAYLVLNFIVTSLLPAKYVGDAVGLSMVVEVVAIVFWAWVLGPIGAILAIPLTVTVKAVLVDANPRARWLAGFLGSAKSLRAETAGEPPDGRASPGS